MDNPHSELHADYSERLSSVQRKLGRCLMRLQQYELLLKRILPNVSFSGYLTELPSQLAQTREVLNGKTMGTLVGMLTKSCLSSSDSDANPGLRDTFEPEGGDEVWIDSRLSLVTDGERHASITAGLGELVKLRNELVHHFFAQFDVTTADGCMSAEEFLDNGYMSIDAHYTTLHGWAKAMSEAQRLMASVFDSSAFHDFFVNDIAASGPVQWERSGIAQGLRDAEAELALEGWTLLNAAITWMSKYAPDLTPKRYGCRSWRHVLHESKQFEVQKRPNLAAFSTSEQPTVVLVWYRSRRHPAKE